MDEWVHFSCFFGGEIFADIEVFDWAAEFDGLTAGVDIIKGFDARDPIDDVVPSTIYAWTYWADYPQTANDNPSFAHFSAKLLKKRH